MLKRWATFKVEKGAASFARDKTILDMNFARFRLQVLHFMMKSRKLLAQSVKILSRYFQNKSKCYVTLNTLCSHL